MEQAPGLANQRAVRRHNLGVVLRHVSEHGPRSRATIALETGLNKTTVSSLVTELIGLDLLVERGLDYRGTVGRPGQVVELSSSGVVALGLEINVDYVAVRALDLTGEERHRALEARDNRRVSGAEVLEHVAALAAGALAAVEEAGLRPVGATVGLPGLVDADRGVLLVAPNLGWRDVPVVDELRHRLGDPGFPVTADNEANLAALAELWEGTARGLSDVLYVSGEIGVGAGLIVRGELFRGSGGFGGEFGHMTLDRGGRACGCGSRGCLETLVGLEALLERAGLPEMGATGGAAGPVRELIERAGGGDERALGALEEAGRWLGVGIASAANLLNFQAVVLGGFFGQLAPWLEGPIAEELETHLLGSSWATPRILPSTLGPGAAVRGAAASSLRRIFADPGWAA
ncbi:MAG TPA: ROK family transcriptional regulator [Solirubrobacteraceae bacterium]|nr:ROK family transcriptional regulator [Solirubrobacteraceae bacterium]